MKTMEKGEGMAGTASKHLHDFSAADPMSFSSDVCPVLRSFLLG